ASTLPIDQHAEHLAVVKAAAAHQRIAARADEKPGLGVAEKLAVLNRRTGVVGDLDAARFAVQKPAAANDRFGCGPMDQDARHGIGGQIAVFQEKLALKNVYRGAAVALAGALAAQRQAANDRVGGADCKAVRVRVIED